MADNYTFMIKTLERPKCLYALLDSLCHYYPKADVVIADDSREPLVGVEDRYPGVQYIWYGHDYGIGACYNDIIDHWITTPITILLDDDFIFTGQTVIERMAAFVSAGLFDIAGGDVYCHRRNKLQHFIGHFSYPEPGILHVEEIPAGMQPPVAVDITMNFFAARTEKLREIRWDETLKVSRHLDFFLRAKRAKAKVGYVGGCRVEHVKEMNATYRAYRWMRMPEHQQLFLKIWKLRKVTGLGEIERTQ